MIKDKWRQRMLRSSDRVVGDSRGACVSSVGRLCSIGLGLGLSYGLSFGLELGLGLGLGYGGSDGHGHLHAIFWSLCHRQEGFGLLRIRLQNRNEAVLDAPAKRRVEIRVFPQLLVHFQQGASQCGSLHHKRPRHIHGIGAGASASVSAVVLVGRLFLRSFGRSTALRPWNLRFGPPGLRGQVLQPELLHGVLVLSGGEIDPQHPVRGPHETRSLLALAHRHHLVIFSKPWEPNFQPVQVFAPL
mmetsp:Transcript_17268/g.65843  ORF Transcript_17268/g.65843 Transcript_17268/m.65843 type:complete len:244 (+) Transcript_17268:114-845(+)